jgi:flagellar hook assembly protein FlgD
VKVSIYNMLGQRVVELANDVQPAGSHQVVWDARNSLRQHVASGVYFYRLEARPLDGSTPFTSIRKMLFLK